MGSRQGQAPILTKIEQKAVLNTFIGTPQQIRNTAIFLLSFRAGLRAKEIAMVKLSDFISPFFSQRGLKSIDLVVYLFSINDRRVYRARCNNDGFG